ncbi:MAG: hypothetical protein HRU15_13245, partial [Planctomycetes bacterium]|nr:hypothetical protein [Planctomycetota bacterium]
SHENDMLGGGDYSEMYKAFSGAQNQAVVSRPGGGSYDDHAPRNMLNKAIRISRQVARLPDNCQTACAEIENFPHHILGKTPRGTAIESTIYLAHGVDSLSYAMICSSLESIDSYQQHFQCLGKWKPFWNFFRGILQDTVPAGVDPYLSSQHAQQCPGIIDNPIDWRRVHMHDVYGISELGISLSPDSSQSRCAVLNAAAAAGISQEEFTTLCQGGLIMCAEAMLVLIEKGFATDLGISIQQHQGNGKELFTDHQFNHGLDTQFWQPFFGHSTAYEVHCADGEALATYADNAAPSSLIVETDTMRLAILGNGPWELWANGARQLQLHRAIDWCANASMPVVLQNAAQVHFIARCNAAGQTVAVFMVNITIDYSPEISLLVRNAHGSHVHMINPEATQSTCLSNNFNQDSDTLTLPSLAPWSVVCLYFSQTEDISL